MIESYLTDKILRLYKNIWARIRKIKHMRILAFVYFFYSHFGPPIVLFCIKLVSSIW
ncbi:hypothetical protein GCM10008904_31160 [Paraclostridium ghonii]|uniref:Uncharacterized protein n=1 Tax=Paraclostridium ghonii TaxID=29358 RepID=A0ABU0MX45_9FIRM|nr:hypothetical protein [Paeniclostridium ghonii]